MLAILKWWRFRRNMDRAMDELRAELQEFAYDGLVQLEADLEEGAVGCGTWDSCVLSYRRGHAGSVDCDREGRRGNVFTRFWDAERLGADLVLAAVRDELAARSVPAPAAAALGVVVYARCHIEPGPAGGTAFVRELRTEIERARRAGL